MKPTKRQFAAFGLLLASLLVAGAAQAGAFGIAPYVEIATEHDTNLFRVPDNNSALAGGGNDPRSDTINRGSIGAVAEWPISRQRLIVGGQVSEVRYNRFDRLDHSESDVRAALEFEVGPAVNGTLSYRRQRRLEDFDNLDTTQPNFVVENRPEIEVFVEVTPSWRVRTQAGYLRREQSLASQQDFDLEQNRFQVELQHLGVPGSVLGAGVEYIDGTFPERDANGLLSREFTQTTGFVSANWSYSGISTFRGRIGYTERDNSGGGDRDFDGVTGNLAYVRTISGKTQATLEVFRQIFSVDEPDANFVRDTGVLARLLWKYSPKLGLSLGLQRTDRQFQGLPGFSENREDTIDEIIAELTYQPFRILGLVVDVRGERRDSNEADERFEALRAGLALRLTLDTD